MPVKRSTTVELASVEVTISRTSATIASSSLIDGQLVDGRAAGDDGAAEETVAGDALVEAEELFADALGVGVEDAVGDVVAQSADVG